MPPACQGAKVPVRCAIEGAFGGRLVGTNMVDTPSHTEVEVVVHATPSDMYGPWNMDPEARGRALYTLLHAFKILGPQIKSLQPSADGSQLCLKYSDANPDRMCWEFGQHGYCPRASTCRWEHIATEAFIITLVMQPLAFDSSPMAMQPAQAITLPGGMVGYVMPMPPSFDQVPPGMVCCAVPVGPNGICTDMAGVAPTYTGVTLEGCMADPEKSNSTAAGTSEHSGSTTPMGLSPSASPRLRNGRACWADIEDDEDA